MGTRLRLGSAVLAISAIFMALMPTMMISDAGASSNRVVTPRCSDSQLVVATEYATGAGGSDGYEVLIANRSGRTCEVYGFARIAFQNSSGRAIKVKVIHRGSMLFATVAPHVVSLAPDTVASFAVSYGEEFVPKDDATSQCVATTMSVVLPTTHPKFYPDGDLAVPVNVDLCIADWVIGLTPIERGAQV